MMLFPRRQTDNLPRIFAGRRRRLFVRLILNGVCQAVVAFGLAYALRSALASARIGVLDWPMISAIATTGLLFFGLRIIEAGDAERLGQDYVMRVRLRLFRRIAYRPVGATGNRRWGVTMTRMISDLNSLRNWVAVGIARSLVASIMVVGLLGTLWVFSPLTGVAVLAMVLICAGISAAFTPLLRQYVREARRRRGRLANNLGEKVFAFHTVRQFGQTRNELSKVRSHSKRLRDALVRRMRLAQVIRVLPQTTQPIAIAAVVVLTSITSSGWNEVPVTIMLLAMVAGALTEIARGWDYRLSFEEARRRIGDVLASPQLTQADDAIELTGSGALSVDLVDLQLGDATGPLNFSASAEDIVRVSGQAGAGKTMLLLLLARFLDSEKGDVFLNGQPIRSILVDSLYQEVQLVTPELPLLRGTVADNLSYGTDVLEDGWINVIAVACGLTNDPSLVEGLDSRVEEQAQNLPRGVRARIALARAATVRPRLLLIDDQSFVTDTEAGDALQRVIELLSPTVLFASNNDKPPIPITQTWQIGPSRLSSNAPYKCKPITAETLTTEQAAHDHRRHCA